jgi:EAL domain-containing protein (putative c-di-GMP-specific phosphodiesterase class I)
MDPNFEDFIAEAVRFHKLCPKLLELELTETLFMGDKNVIREKMSALSLLGFTFALDDFGTGYSSLSYLQRLPINKLKIDRSFVMDILDANTPISIVDSIIQLGRNLKMDIIAEGVETNDQCTYLSRHGCHSFQGYLFSRPLTEENFLKFIRSHSA